MVLCLLFMLQYVLAGIGQSQNTGSAPNFFMIDIHEVESGELAVNHVQFIQISDVLIQTPNPAGCPLPVPPTAYHFITGDVLPEVPVATNPVRIGTKVYPNWIVLNDQQQLSDLRSQLAKSGISIDIYKTRGDRPPGSDIYNLLLSGYLEDLKAPIPMSIYMCQCDLTQTQGGTVGLSKPHPVILTLMSVTRDTSTETEFIAYNHVSQDPRSGKDGGGWMFLDAQHNNPTSYPVRRFDFLLSPNGETRSSNFEIRHHSAADGS